MRGVIAGKCCSVLALSSVGEAACSESVQRPSEVCIHLSLILFWKFKLNKLSSIFTQLPSFSSAFTNHGPLWCCTSLVFLFLWQWNCSCWFFNHGKPFFFQVSAPVTSLRWCQPASHSPRGTALLKEKKYNVFTTMNLLGKTCFLIFSLSTECWVELGDTPLKLTFLL